MSKVRKIAALAFLTVILVAGSAAAGPGGNRNGDPDGPQRTHPSITAQVGLNDVQGGSVSARTSERRVSATWEFLLRMFLRTHGIALG